MPQWGPVAQARIVVNRRLPDLEKSGHVKRGGTRLSSVTGRTEVEWSAATSGEEGSNANG